MIHPQSNSATAAQTAQVHQAIYNHRSVNLIALRVMLEATDRVRKQTRSKGGTTVSSFLLSTVSRLLRLTHLPRQVTRLVTIT
jgi:hypothetical protein